MSSNTTLGSLFGHLLFYIFVYFLLAGFYGLKFASADGSPQQMGKEESGFKCASNVSVDSAKHWKPSKRFKIDGKMKCGQLKDLFKFKIGKEEVQNEMLIGGHLEDFLEMPIDCQTPFGTIQTTSKQTTQTNIANASTKTGTSETPLTITTTIEITTMTTTTMMTTARVPAHFVRKESFEPGEAYLFSGILQENWEEIVLDMFGKKGEKQQPLLKFEANKEADSFKFDWDKEKSQEILISGSIKGGDHIELLISWVDEKQISFKMNDKELFVAQFDEKPEIGTSTIDADVVPESGVLNTLLGLPVVYEFPNGGTRKFQINGTPNPNATGHLENYSITFSGKVPKNAKSFTVDLIADFYKEPYDELPEVDDCCQPGYFLGSVYHLQTDFDNGNAKISSYLIDEKGNRWEGDMSFSNPFKPGEPFKALIRIEEFAKFTLFLNDIYKSETFHYIGNKNIANRQLRWIQFKDDIYIYEKPVLVKEK